MTSLPYHIPALLQPTLDGLNINPDGIYVDATFGGGGHSRAILERLSPEGHLYGFDRDIDAAANAIQDPRFTFVHSNFAFVRNFLRFYGAGSADGILADLGVSFHHFDDAQRGFSFRAEAPLDMRMNQSAQKSAAEVVNTYSEAQLAEIFTLYGELPKARALAKAIVQKRGEAPLLTTTQLVALAEPLLNPKQQKKELAQLFQALRIEVNGELDALKALLAQSLDVLRPGGRLAIITYHSLEDRLVKNFFRAGNLEGKVEKDFFGHVNTPWVEVTRKPVVPNPEEIEANPRSRSAKLRIGQLKQTEQ